MTEQTAIRPARLSLLEPAVELRGEAPGVWLVHGADVRSLDDALVASVLSPEESARAAAFRLSGDRETYTACHLGLRLILGRLLDRPPRDVPLVREDCPGCGGPHGRPAVAGGELEFSLSHTRSLGLLAVAGRTVGVDVEPLPKAATVRQVGPRLHPGERADLDALPDDQRAAGFARAWTRTEAYLKGLGIGLGRSPDADYLGAGPAPTAALPGWTISDVHIDEGHAAALALADPR